MDELVSANNITVSPGIYDALLVKISIFSDSVSVDEVLNSSMIANSVLTEASP